MEHAWNDIQSQDESSELFSSSSALPLPPTTVGALMPPLHTTSNMPTLFRRFFQLWTHLVRVVSLLLFFVDDY